MGNGSHNTSCATAQRHACRCTGCGGSLHGWVSLVDLARGDHSERQRRRERHERRLRTKPGSQHLRGNRENREASTDLARLDITVWLAATTPETSGLVAIHVSPVDQVATFAEEMTRGTWQEIATDLERGMPDATKIKRELANHGWCDLFIGLIQVIDETQSALSAMRDMTKCVVKGLILRSSMRVDRPHVTKVVVDVVVDRVWQAFKSAAFAGVPLLNVVTSLETLRALRILAVFICPAPDNHREVREHALKPLGSDTAKILTEQTKARLADVFTEWQSTGPDQSTR